MKGMIGVIPPASLPSQGHEVDEDVLEAGPVEGDGPAVDKPGGLVPDHLAGLEHHVVQLALVVEDLKRPVGVDLLVDVEDGGHHVGLHVVQVGVQPGAPRVLPQPVYGGPPQPEPVPRPFLSQRSQRAGYCGLSVLLQVQEPISRQQSALDANVHVGLEIILFTGHGVTLLGLLRIVDLHAVLTTSSTVFQLMIIICL